MVVDSIEQKHYDDLGWAPTFSPDSQHMAYEAKVDSQQQFVVLDGQEQKPYEAAAYLVFSPDNGQLVWPKKTTSYLWSLMEEQKHYDTLGSAAVFSQADGKMAYVAQIGD